MDLHALFVRSKGFIVAVLYGLCSAGMAFANKAVLDTQQYNYPAFIMCCQMIFTLCVFEGLRISKIINIEAYSLQRGRTFLLASVLYAMNSILALTALSGINIPIYGAIKRCVPLVILIVNVAVFRKGYPSFKTMVAVLMITTGCTLASYGDLAFDIKAYTFGVASVITQALYLLLVQQSNNDKLSPLDTTHINSINTLPMFIITALAIGELPSALHNFKFQSVSFILEFLTVIVIGCFLNFTLFLCTQYNCALTTSVVGSLKSIAQTAIGIVTFGGISLNVFTVSGISVNLTGGIFYSYVKYTEAVEKEHEQDKKPAENKILEKMNGIESQINNYKKPEITT